LPGSIDAYMDFSQSLFFGWPAGHPMHCLDVPDSQKPPQIYSPPLLTTPEVITMDSVNLVNTLVRCSSNVGWATYDILATYPPLEKPQIHITSPSHAKAVKPLSFLIDADDHSRS